MALVLPVVSPRAGQVGNPGGDPGQAVARVREDLAPAREGLCDDRRELGIGEGQRGVGRGRLLLRHQEVGLGRVVPSGEVQLGAGGERVARPERRSAGTGLPGGARVPHSLAGGQHDDDR